MTDIKIFRESQQSSVADPFSALIAIIGPILFGLLYSLKQDVATEVGGYANVKLKMLDRLRRKGDGDIGICFEYAVHEAIRKKQPHVTERVHDALTRYCKVLGSDTDSILFGAEKSGALQLIDTAHNILTDESRILTGTPSQPPKLKQYLQDLALAFRSNAVRETLPSSIKGLWKADLFVGRKDTDKWVGATVKINPQLLEGAKGLRLGIVPAHQGRSDGIRLDSSKNLVVCPIPYDASFMEAFYVAWGIVMQFLNADAKMPKEVNLPVPLQRQVASELESRREFNVVEVIEALKPLAQPHLLANVAYNANVEVLEPGTVEVLEPGTTTESLISPIPVVNG